MKIIDKLDDMDETVYHILHTALSYIRSEYLLNNLSQGHACVTRLLPYCINDAQKLVEKETYQQENNCDDQRLNNVLSSFGRIKTEVPPDGDCLFSSIVLHLEKVFISEIETDLIEHLNTLGVNSHNCSVQVLRNLMVEEWKGNKKDYQPFFLKTFK